METVSENITRNVLGDGHNNTFQKKRKKWTKSEKTIFAMAASGLVFLFVFSYLPMYGVLLAFKDANYALNLQKELFRSDWVGFEIVLIKNSLTFLLTLFA